MKRLVNPDGVLAPAYTGRLATEPVPALRLPDSEMEPGQAYQYIHDELMLDGSSRLNLATFVTTWMEPDAQTLMAETFDKNMIDKDEYPATAAIESRCVNMVADLFHAPGLDPGDPASATGVSTIGSSEAVMLAGLALKWRWRAGGSGSGTPNLVLGSNVQVVWEKFCRYFEVEPRYLPMAHGRYTITPEQVRDAVDENTIGVVAILGTTFTGELEPVADIVAALDAVAGNGGPVVVWREKQDLPEDLVFRVNYLGGDMPTFTLNFSRPGNQVVGQYYNFLRLGRAGYTAIMETLRDNAVRISAVLAEIPDVEVISDGSAIPVIAFGLRDGLDFDVFDISHEMRARDWQVPAYTMPDDATDVAVLRIVVREGFSADLGRLLCEAITDSIAALREGRGGHSNARAFAH